ncbi:MAG: hypothetical protein NTV23_11235 [Propionibacteriales bacterium]|nr:hypothetical protein [Propionibacteriales bacterium]
MLGRRGLPLAAVALLTGVALAACSDSPAAVPASSAPTATASATEEAPVVDPETGKEFKLEKPRAAATISPSAELTSVPGAGVIYSAADARTIQGFPVPKGARVKDPGASEETWQFDIFTTEPDDVLEFYKQVLPQMGYTVRTDVTYTQAYEEVRWDLVFDGRVSGSMVVDPVNKTVFVVVNPPGQPAFAGDEQE